MLGVDIHSTAVRLLELSGSGDGCRVETCGIEPLATDAVVDNHIHDADAVADTIARLVARTSPGTRNAAVAVPAAAAITRLVEMDAALTGSDLDAQLRVESDRYIPFPADEIRMDFRVLGPLADNAERVKVLVVAARAGDVDLLAEVLTRGGLRPQVVDVTSFALERAFRWMQPALPGAADRDTVAVFDIDGAVTRLNVFHRGRGVYSRDPLSGGGRQVEDIRSRYGIVASEDQPAAGVDDPMAAFADGKGQEPAGSISEQISGELQFFHGSTGFHRVDHILLTGSRAALDDLPARIQDRTGIDCSLANPFAATTPASGVDADTLAKTAPAMMVACGLALRGLAQ